MDGMDTGYGWVLHRHRLDPHWDDDMGSSLSVRSKTRIIATDYNSRRSSVYRAAGERVHPPDLGGTDRFSSLDSNGNIRLFSHRPHALGVTHHGHPEPGS